MRVLVMFIFRIFLLVFRWNKDKSVTVNDTDAIDLWQHTTMHGKVYSVSTDWKLLYDKRVEIL